jgi:translation elongation factor aEF-1 beta
MKGVAAVITKVMPSSVETNLKILEDEIKNCLVSEGAQNISFKEEPVAFGLKAIIVKFAWPEEKSTDLIESKIQGITGVSSVTIEDYRRAFG